VKIAFSLSQIAAGLSARVFLALVVGAIAIVSPSLIFTFTNPNPLYRNFISFRFLVAFHFQVYLSPTF
jgi:hypothetical protein